MKQQEEYLKFSDFIIKDKNADLKSVNENIHDNKIELLLKFSYEGLKGVLKYNTADYNYYIRILFNYIKKKIDKQYTIEQKFIDLYNDKLLNNLINESYKYLQDNIDFFNTDKSLSAITLVCSNPKLVYDPTIEDKYLIQLSHYFNFLTDTNRKLLRCYDCGTNARAIFLNLIKKNRNNEIIFTSAEHKQMANLYKQQNYIKNNTLDNLNSCLNKLNEVNKETVFIISLGFLKSGHVFVLEKRFINGKPLVLHYQSALNSHMIIDFLYLIDIVDKIKNHRSVNYVKMLNDIKYLFNKKHWDDNDKKLFASWFLYTTGDNIVESDFTKPIISDNYNFTWTYITY